MRAMRTVRHRILEQQRDTPAEVAERLRYREVQQRVDKERLERWPEITPENAAEVIRWQNERIAEYVNGL